MRVNITNIVPYLRTARSFPFNDIKELSVEVGIAYIETANAVNQRIIGIFPTQKPAITGETWFITSQKQQSFRQVYTFTSTAAINHGINLSNIDRFTRAWGTFTDGTNWYGITFGSSIATTTPGLITFYIAPTQIIFLVGAGTATLTSGTIVLEWLSRAELRGET